MERAIRKSVHLATIWLALWGLSESVAAQTPLNSSNGRGRAAASGCAAVVDRPCVGLVLGGGGARGGAHIGVLQVLEDLRIPIDVIAGTSIGAIVGGLYSTGLTAEDLTAFTESLDWQQLFLGSPPREDLAYRRKQDDVRFPVQLELGLDGRGVRLPRGLITGQSLHTLLSGLGLAVGSVTDFDTMPIPFRAIAADLADGTPVSLSSGDLARAIRASMSIPGLFVPVEIGDQLLIDGGISQNVPVSVVQEMGADFVIAVDVATPPDPLEELGTAVAISRQIVRFPIQRATQGELDLLSDDDVVLTPDLSDVRASDFPSTLEAAEAGAVAARGVADKLRRVALSEDEYDAWRTRIRAQRLPPPTVESIRLDNRSGLADEQLRDLVAQEVGALLDVERLAEDIAGIYGLGFFESVTYHVEGLTRTANTPPSGTLVITVVPEPWGPHYLRFGLGFRDDLGGNSAFGFLGGYTLTQLNRWGAELRSEVELGEVRRIASEWYQPLGGGGVVFLAPALSYEREILDVYANRSRVAQRRRTQWGATFDMGVRLGNWGEFRTGLTRGKASLKTRTGATDSIDIEDDVGSLRAALSIDRLDTRSFPRAGDAFTAVLSRSLQGLGDEAGYSRLGVRYLHAQPVGAGSLLIRLEGGTSLGDDLPLWDEFSLGGLFRLSGVRDRALTGDDMALAGLTFYRPLATLPTTLSGGDLLLGLSVEAGHAWDTEEPITVRDLQVGGSAFVGLETLLGPVYLGYGRAEVGEGAWYFILGRTF